MSAEPPSAWEQVCPRSVRLSPDGLFVPAATLRVMLRHGRRLTLLYAGHALDPWIRDGEAIVIVGGRRARRGDLLLCDRGGWGDLLRAVRPLRGGAWRTVLDAFPRRRAEVAPESILGVLDPTSARNPAGAAARVCVFAGLGAARFVWRRIEQAPAWDRDPLDSVLDKYRSQVSSYRDARHSNLTPEHLEAIAAHTPAGGEVLVCGSGAGGEVVHLARAGYRVTGFDALPGMVEAARRVAAEASVAVRLLVGDVRALRLGHERFDFVYMTPLLYSFISGQQRRIAALRRIAAHLRPGGGLLYSAHLHRSAWSWVQTRLAWTRRTWATKRGEPGDWYTWYLTPPGTIGYSYLRRFVVGEVLAEARAAGFGSVTRLGSHFVASKPAGS